MPVRPSKTLLSILLSAPLLFLSADSTSPSRRSPSRTGVKKKHSRTQRVCFLVVVVSVTRSPEAHSFHIHETTLQDAFGKKELAKMWPKLLPSLSPEKAKDLANVAGVDYDASKKVSKDGSLPRQASVQREVCTRLHITPKDQPVARREKKAVFSLGLL